MKIKDLNLFKEIKKQELLDALKYEASEVHIKDIMDFYVHLVADGIVCAKILSKGLYRCLCNWLYFKNKRN